MKHSLIKLSEEELEGILSFYICPGKCSKKKLEAVWRVFLSSKLSEDCDFFTLDSVYSLLWHPKLPSQISLHSWAEPGSKYLWDSS